ncbi:diaminopimelate decarboxylase [Collimonas antrihumi]|uniref:diaminopimelate decarboxylase n=1 Tax=Collimonas antrihumi TaxID=1940615 RepID=UPI001B8CE58D|nr:diaminopimelate decarboxylase [Collimonas antrihumi]
MNTISPDMMADLARSYGTPLWIYDSKAIENQVKKLRAFDVIRFAQKACSNTHILKLLREQGVTVDAVSLGEIERALRAGFSRQGTPAGLIFTADVIDAPTLAKVTELDIEVNAGSIDMLEQLGAVKPGHRVWLRVNPGFGHGHSHKTNTGGENSKHGIWHADLPQALAVIGKHSLHLVGLHMHIGSGVDYDHLERVCATMTALVKQLGHDIEAISTGGGLCIPYRENAVAVDTNHYFGVWDAARKDMEQYLGHPLRLEIEPGRFLVAEAGILLSEVRAVKNSGANHFVLVDAGFNDLMRPSMYGSYHRISVIHNSETSSDAIRPRPTVVAGPLCESGDVFTQHEGGIVEPRMMPGARVGDYLVFHDTGAYGASMSSNYNSRPLLAEVLIDDNAHRLIRRRQSISELIALETGL